MSTNIAILAPGAMGSAVARRLKENGARVLTSLAGRSEATAKRAAAAGMIAVGDADIANADIILSIVPLADALRLAERLAGAVAKSRKKPVVVDCNAINVETVLQVERIIAASGARFVDAAITGLPPRVGTEGPAFYFSGAHAQEFAILGAIGPGCAPDRRSHRRGLGTQNVLCRHCKGADRGWRRDGACGHAGGSGRCVARRTGPKPTANSHASGDCSAGHDPEILSLGGRNA